jgi:hypothetical protein
MLKNKREPELRGLAMRTILIFLMIALPVASACAETDRVLAERLAQLVRDERDRQDCMGRETLARPRPESSEQLKEAAAVVATLCSQNIRKRILQNIIPHNRPPAKRRRCFRSAWRSGASVIDRSAGQAARREARG